MRWPLVKCWAESPATKYVSSSPPFCVICGNSVYSLNINWYFGCSVKCFQTSIITSSRCRADSVTSRFRLRAVQQWWLLCINKVCHDSFWHMLSQIQEPSCHKVLLTHRGCLGSNLWLSYPYGRREYQNFDGEPKHARLKSPDGFSNMLMGDLPLEGATKWNEICFDLWALQMGIEWLPADVP